MTGKAARSSPLADPWAGSPPRNAGSPAAAAPGEPSALTGAISLALALFFFIAIVFGAAPFSKALAASSGDRQHIVYFEGTPQELEIYKIYGRLEGPTIMILGGIQGDEPGAFMSADLYVDIALKRGNLIVVPRANFKSIILFDRGPDGDMNRKFDGVQDHDPDRDRVEIIKNLMAESDLFLNLHDGSGFFRPEWESDMANPDRYGQCIIADADVYTHPASGRVLHLGDDARAVVEAINADIREERYKFRFSNHDTLANDSRHKEQRKSATYYALTKLGIPAYGVETSKQLPSLEMKIHQHNLAINAFMELYGVVPEQPRINLDPPALKYMIISVNGRLPVAVADGQTLLVSPGDTVEVVHVGSNYDRGLSVDLIGLGSLNDIRMPLAVTKPTTIIARRDNVRFGQINLELLPDNLGPSPQLLLASTGDVIGASAGIVAGQLEGQKGSSSQASSEDAPAAGGPPNGSSSTASAQAGIRLPASSEGSPPDAASSGSPTSPIGSAGSLTVALNDKSGASGAARDPELGSGPVVNGIKGFLVEIDGQPRKLQPGETLTIPKGAKIKMIDIDGQVPARTVMNLRGFIGRPGDATGHDRGTTCDTAKDLIPRFAISRNGTSVYQLGAEDGPKLLAAAYLEFVTPKLRSVRLASDGVERTLSLGQRWSLKAGSKVTVLDVALAGDLPLESPRYTIGGRSFPASLPQTLVMPDIAVSLAVFSHGELAGKVVLAPAPAN